jgi:hypothetical protein
LRDSLRHGAEGRAEPEPRRSRSHKRLRHETENEPLTLLALERCRKPPWYVTCVPGGVRGGRREASPYSICSADLGKGVEGGPPASAGACSVHHDG